MAKGQSQIIGVGTLGDDVLKIAIIGVLAFSVYTLWTARRIQQDFTGWAGGGLEYTVDTTEEAINRAIGGGKTTWGNFWMETTGSKGLGLTGESSGEGHPNREKRAREAGDKSYWGGEEGYIPDWLY
jgi:hypothetical protein